MRFPARASRVSVKAVSYTHLVVPETRITRLARCRHAWNPRQRYWHVETDVWGKTNVCGIRVAGDSAGARGADAAIASGEAVALDICRELGALTLETRDSLAKAALFLSLIHI